MPWSVRSVARLPSLHLWRKRRASSGPDEATTRSGPKKAQAATRRNNDIQAGIPPLTLPSRGSRHARGSPERRPARAQTQGYEPCRLGLQIARNSRTHQREVRSSNPLCYFLAGRNPRNSGRLVRHIAVCEPNSTVLPRSAPEIARESLPAKFRFPDHETESPKRGLSAFRGRAPKADPASCLRPVSAARETVSGCRFERGAPWRRAQ